ncbi:uncharacterized protein LOC142233061 [Haematobia irritans]|uniref:uncharacterized protein LOC142233061 n=1 Tax=Haematobia irritans TaxID=7368 RepID=UPI003F50975D
MCCSFCPRKHLSNTFKISEYMFTCCGRNVTSYDIYKNFPADLKQVFSDATSLICPTCIKGIQNYYEFIQQIRESFNAKLKNETTSVLKDQEPSKQHAVLEDNFGCTKPMQFRPILPKMVNTPSKIRTPCSVSTFRIYRCIECSKTFKSHKNLRQHEFNGVCNRDVISGIFTCRYCHLCFKNANIMTSHESSHLQQFSCVLCKNKLFTSKGYLTRHLIKRHEHSFLHFFCGECSEFAAMESCEEVKKHFDAVHNTAVGVAEEESKECLDEDDMDLEMHEEFLDEFLLTNSNENSFQFSECWEALDLHLPDMLQAQNTTLHHSNSLAFPCPKCLEQFNNPQPLLQHLAESHNLTVLVCPKCQQSFSSSNDLKLHKNACNKVISKTISINCPYCTKAFSSTVNLKQHLRIVHTRLKKHICLLCDKQFSTLDHLKKHVLSQHQNERKYECDICSATFSQLCHLKQHLAIHKSGKTIQCSKCGEKFLRSIDLKRHQKKYCLI